MPRPKRGQSIVRNASAHRWASVETSSSTESSSDEFGMDVDDPESSFNEVILLTDIGDLAEMCKSTCDTKYLSTLLYMSLRHFNIKWQDTDDFLKNIGLMTAQTCHKWATVFMRGEYEEFSGDLRGGKHVDSFFDVFPEIEVDAKAFVIQACSRKTGEFKALYLAQFIDDSYYTLMGIQKQIGDGFIRSERSCRLDLRRWGAKFEANSQRPYFEGHERADVVKHRNEFINHFLKDKGFYYTITDGETPTWRMPTLNPAKIIICKHSNEYFLDMISIILSMDIFTSSR